MVSASNPKGDSRNISPAPKSSGLNLFKYFADVRAEARRVTWPSRRTTIVTTGAVLVMVAITSVFFFVVDQVIGLGIRGLFGVGG